MRVNLNLLKLKPSSFSKELYKSRTPCTKSALNSRMHPKSKRLIEIERLDFTEEDARKVTNDDGTITEVDYEFIELRLGNHCNTICRTCNPHSTSRWKKDYDKIFPNKYAGGYLFFTLSILLYILISELGPDPKTNLFSLSIQVISQKIILIIFLFAVYIQTLGVQILASNE